MAWVTAAVTAASALAAAAAAKAKQDEARRVAKMNANLGALDTKFSPFVQAKSVKQDVPDAGPGVFSGALAGGLGGFTAGQNISKGIGQGNAYDQLLKGADVDNLGIGQNGLLRKQMGLRDRMIG